MYVKHYIYILWRMQISEKYSHLFTPRWGVFPSCFFTSLGTKNLFFPVLEALPDLGGHELTKGFPSHGFLWGFFTKVHSECCACTSFRHLGGWGLDPLWRGFLWGGWIQETVFGDRGVRRHAIQVCRGCGCIISGRGVGVAQRQILWWFGGFCNK